MKDFAAIDFETANNERSSVCSVGVVIVRGGEVVDRFYSLIKRSRSITITGAVRCMVFALQTQTMRRFFPKCGS